MRSLWLDVWNEGFGYWYARWRREDDPIGGKDMRCTAWGFTKTHAINRARKILAQREYILLAERRRQDRLEQTTERVKIEIESYA